MDCQYCGTRNTDYDHRCNRCGRRLQQEPVIRTAAIPKPAQQVEPQVEPATAHEERSRPAYQPSLFREHSRVIPFSSIAPERAEAVARRRAQTRPAGPAEAARTIARPALPEQPKAEPPARTKSAQKPASRAAFKKVLEDAQRSLDFPTPGLGRPGTHASSTTITGSRDVATPVHRLLAGLLDVSMMLIGLAVFSAIFFAAGGEVHFNSVTTPLFLSVPILIGLVYKTLYCLANGDTSGLRWTYLKLCNLDGSMPNRRDRFARMLSGCVSLIAVGLGFLWALTDEEQLTWHDHMSGIIPTPRD